MSNAIDECGRLRENIRRLLELIGANPDKCRGCGETIWFVRTKHGRMSPITADGLVHFIDCPKASQFRRQRRETARPVQSDGQERTCRETRF